jgi:gas vesicle protein
MGQDPSDIRAGLEETRGRVGAEVDALSYKTDVSARVGDYVDEKKQAVKDKFTGARDAVTGTASRAVPDGQRVSRMKDTAERNPMGLAVGAAAVGFVAGLMIPSTRAEDERLGQMSDRLVEAAKETAGDAVERGKQVAQDAAETAKESGRQQSQELASNLQDRAQESGRSPESTPTPQNRSGRAKCGSASSGQEPSVFLIPAKPFLP